jgi:heme-degrading monooxygenase HmoA
MTAPPGGHAVIWRYQVEPERTAEFELRYGPSGDWVRLFSRAPGYRGTALLKDRADPLVYVTVDRWESEAAFASFQARYAEAYRELDASCAALTRAEARLGSFTELE